MSADLAAALDRAKACIAGALLGGDRTVERQLGDLVLRPHQLTAVGRLLEIIASHRGALLADAVGLGKTYVALAVAREHRSAVIVCPSALRGMWERAMRVAGCAHPILSIEALSRGVLPERAAELLIVDEAHHLRTPGTRRYEAVAHLARRARLLLLSATPMHNARRDLTAVLALFAGSGVDNWSDRALARLIVRRDDATADQSMPVISGPHSLSPDDDDDCLDAILAIPPAVPAADEGVAHGLATISLVHLWASSRAALVASARKRLARATALRDAVESGHVPTASELGAWSYCDGALQLAFPMFAADEQQIDRDALNSQLGQFVDGAKELIERCRRDPDPDHSRATLLRRLRATHHGERIVAFSQYASTITALGRIMRGDAGIATVTAAGARIASGPVTREEVLRQFAVDAGPVHPVERIDLLLTTDLLSEGIDLRGASVIVHLDLPWNPARLEQRVGRSRRLGSRFGTIHVYTIVPPTAAERFIELRRRLSEKIRAARDLVGGAFDPLGDAVSSASPVDSGEALRREMRDWISPGEDTNWDGTVGAARSLVAGWIAAVVTSGVARMIGDVGGGITDDPTELSPVVRQLGMPAPICSRRADAAAIAIREWIAARDATAGVGLGSAAKRAVLDRLTQTVARTPRHHRSAAIAVAQRTRAALAGATGVGTERVLAALARATVDDEAWLRSVESFGILHADDSHGAQQGDGIVAIILLENVSEGAATPG